MVDAILVLTLMEAVAVAGFRLLTPAGIVRTLLPGVLVMLALRAALADAAWPWVPLALAAALIAHVFDLWGRSRR